MCMKDEGGGGINRETLFLQDNGQLFREMNTSMYWGKV